MSYNNEVFRAWLGCIQRRLEEERAVLDRLDAEIGDGDHGSNLSRGFRKVVELPVGAEEPPASLFKAVAMALISTVGGASGPLYGTLFLETGKAMGSSTEFSGQELGRCLQSGVSGVQRLGKASAGDKTMLDALIPAVDALAASGDASAAARAAEQGREATIPLQARKGRASYLGVRSIGHVDPGAASAALIFSCLAQQGS